MSETRARRVHLLLSSAEWDMLLCLCDEYGHNVSSMIRDLIRKEYKKFDKPRR